MRTDGNAGAAGTFRGDALTCRRGGRIVFANLSFRLAAGEALVVVGPNGSGKSSLLRMMAGLLTAEVGSLSWNGCDIRENASAHRASLCYSGHLDAVKPTLTLLDNLAFWARARGTPNSKARDLGLRALQRFGLAPLADFPSNLLSEGQRRRLGLARLLLAPAALWLLDEPTIALDAASVEILIERMRAHRGADGRIVIATHGRLADAGALGKADRLDMAEYAPSPVMLDRT